VKLTGEMTPRAADSTRNIPRAPSAKGRRRSPNDRRRQILGILLMAGGFLITLSIIAYTRRDEALLENLSPLDLLRLVWNSDVKARVGGIQNRFGLFGALVSNFFINSTVGYASILISLLMLVWGWIVLRKSDVRKPLTLTNYALILLLLFSSAMGVVNIVAAGVGKEWSGTMGAFMAEVVTKLFGGVGASIVLLTAIFITVVFAIDLDIHKSLDRFKSFGEGLMERLRAAREPGGFRMSSRSEVMINQAENEEDALASPGSDPDFAEMPADMSADLLEKIPDEGADEPEDAAVGAEDRPLVMELPTLNARRTPEPETGRPVPPAPVENDQTEIDYVFPSVELLDPPRQADVVGQDELKANAELVREKLAHFGVEIESVSVTPGPVITLYELVPASGVKISRIVSLADDLALALAARGIRIIAPIPGKSAVGVEIPNKNPSIVYLRSVLNSQRFRETKAGLPLALGKTISGEVYTDDLAKMPHLLIAGSTGSGKSVGINTILASLIFRLHPSDVKFIIIDPKKIELTNYGKLNRHFLAVSPDIDEEIVTSPASAVSVLKSVELEMEKRYDRLAAAGVRNIQDYNDRLKAGRLKDTEAFTHRKIPYLVVVIDELADLMMTAAREVEEPIARLAQLARAVGIHLVLATQRPSVDVITGVIKANFPSRIAYQVASKTDSRTILDMNGAEQLLGSGDMLYLPSGSPKPVRIQSAYVSMDEVERLTDYIARQQGYNRAFQLPSVLERRRSGMSRSGGNRDEFFEEAARLIVRHQQGSVSLLQRRLKVGYSRAARLVDELEAAGIVGPFDGSKARAVLIESDPELELKLKEME
jgi:DNA segregation ATPase FtsK/SpoIIIE, S-DNA-T family